MLRSAGPARVGWLLTNRPRRSLEPSARRYASKDQGRTLWGDHGRTARHSVHAGAPSARGRSCTVRSAMQDRAFGMAEVQRSSSTKSDNELASGALSKARFSLSLVAHLALPMPTTASWAFANTTPPVADPSAALNR